MTLRTLAISSVPIAIAVGITTLLTAPTAHANGRFPNAQQVRELAPGRLVIAGTYGLLVTTNDGKDFGYVCETELFGKTSMGSWVDPLLESLPDGTIVTGSHDQARSTSDLGCSFKPLGSLPFNPEFLPGEAGATGPNGLVADVCQSYEAKAGMLALTTIKAADGTTQEHRIYKTSDGLTWSQLGKPIPASVMNLVMTLDAAPSRSQRIYVSGSLKGSTVLAVTDDAGETWTSSAVPIDDEAGVDGVYIGGVSPTDPERVYLRVRRAGEAEDGSSTWDDSLLVSDNGGKAFRDVLRRKGSLMGFAISPDGKTIAAGFGDPMIAPLVTTDTDLGIYAASASDLMFTQKLPLLPVSCLRWTSSALYVCARDDDPSGMMGTGAPQFHLGVFRGTGLPASLADIKPLLKLKDVRGPLPWADKRANVCAVEWTDGDPNNPGGQSVCTAFNACTVGGTTAPGTDALVCGASTSSGGAGGAGGASSASGGNAQGGGSTANGGAGTSGAKSTGGSTSAGASGGDSSSSGCGVARHAPASAGAWGVLLALFAALRRRARREGKASFRSGR